MFPFLSTEPKVITARGPRYTFNYVKVLIQVNDDIHGSSVRNTVRIQVLDAITIHTDEK